MWVDHFNSSSAAVAPRPKPPQAEARSVPDQVDDLLKLVNAMLKRVMPDGETMDESIPLREGKETVTALTSMFSAVMRYQEELKGQEQHEIFRAAVTNVLKEMDRDQGQHFLDRLATEMERLEGLSKFATGDG